MTDLSLREMGEQAVTDLDALPAGCREATVEGLYLLRLTVEHMPVLVEIWQIDPETFEASIFCQFESTAQKTIHKLHSKTIHHV